MKNKILGKHGKDIASKNHRIIFNSIIYILHAPAKFALSRELNSVPFDLDLEPNFYHCATPEVHLCRRASIMFPFIPSKLKVFFLSRTDLATS